MVRAYEMVPGHLANLLLDTWSILMGEAVASITLPYPVRFLHFRGEQTTGHIQTGASAKI